MITEKMTIDLGTGVITEHRTEVKFPSTFDRAMESMVGRTVGGETAINDVAALLRDALREESPDVYVESVESIDPEYINVRLRVTPKREVELTLVAERVYPL